MVNQVGLRLSCRLHMVGQGYDTGASDTSGRLRPPNFGWRRHVGSADRQHPLTPPVGRVCLSPCLTVHEQVAADERAPQMPMMTSTRVVEAVPVHERARRPQFARDHSDAAGEHVVSVAVVVVAHPRIAPPPRGKPTQRPTAEWSAPAPCPRSPVASPPRPRGRRRAGRPRGSAATAHGPCSRATDVARGCDLGVGNVLICRRACVEPVGRWRPPPQTTTPRGSADVGRS